MSDRIDPKYTLGLEIAQSIHAQLKCAAERIGRRSDPTNGRIHYARSTCKKIRAGLKLISSGQKKFFRQEARRLNQAARNLAKWRNAQAMVEGFYRLLERNANSAERQAFEPLLRSLLSHRSATVPPAAELHSKLAGCAEFLRKSERRLANCDVKIELPAVAANYRRAYKRARLASLMAQTHASDETLREWRKAAKAYACQCHLLRAADPLGLKTLRRELGSLTRLLGDDHDLTLIRHKLAKLRQKNQLKITEQTFHAAMELIEARQRALRAEALTIGQKIFADRPREVQGRMIRWWRLAELEAN